MAAWDCHLMKSSPRYEKWRNILGSDEVPIVAPVPVTALLGAETTVVYQLDLAKLSSDQRARLIDFIVESFKENRERVEAELDSTGFPIRQVDVVVAFDHRFFTRWPALEITLAWTVFFGPA